MHCIIDSWLNWVHLRSIWWLGLAIATTLGGNFIIYLLKSGESEVCVWLDPKVLEIVGSILCGLYVCEGVRCYFRQLDWPLWSILPVLRNGACLRCAHDCHAGPIIFIAAWNSIKLIFMIPVTKNPYLFGASRSDFICIQNNMHVHMPVIHHCENSPR